MWSIVKAERNEDTWILWKGRLPGKSMVVPFPEIAFPDAEDQKVILSLRCCRTAIVHLHDLLKDMLQGCAPFKSNNIIGVVASWC